MSRLTDNKKRAGGAARSEKGCGGDCSSDCYYDSTLLHICQYDLGEYEVEIECRVESGYLSPDIARDIYGVWQDWFPDAYAEGRAARDLGAWGGL